MLCRCVAHVHPPKCHAHLNGHFTRCTPTTTTGQVWIVAAVLMLLWGLFACCCWSLCIATEGRSMYAFHLHQPTWLVPDCCQRPLEDLESDGEQEYVDPTQRPIIPEIFS